MRFKIDDYMINVAQKQNTYPVRAKILGLILSISKTKQRLENSTSLGRRKINKKNLISNSVTLVVVAEFCKYNYLLSTASCLLLMPVAVQSTARNTAKEC